MSADRAALEQRKGRLLERSAQQREQLLGLVDDVDAMLGRARHLRAVMLRQARWPVLGAAAAMLLLRPKLLARWSARLWLGWRGWRALRRRADALLAVVRGR